MNVGYFDLAYFYGCIYVMPCCPGTMLKAIRRRIPSRTEYNVPTELGYPPINSDDTYDALFRLTPWPREGIEAWAKWTSPAARRSCTENWIPFAILHRKFHSRTNGGVVLMWARTVLAYIFIYRWVLIDRSNVDGAPAWQSVYRPIVFTKKRAELRKKGLHVPRQIIMKFLGFTVKYYWRLKI